MDIEDIFTNDPDKPEEIYEIQSIHEGYVKAINADGKIAIKILLEMHLIADKSWVKERK
jgi:hypothetical protein